MTHLKVSGAKLTAAAASEGFLCEEQPPPVICQPNTETMIGKQRCPDVLLDPRLAFFSLPAPPLRPMSAHKNKPVSQKMVLQKHTADGGYTPLHLPACCSPIGKKQL